MYSTQLFDHLSNVRMQVQEKRRKNQYGGMWGAPVNLFMQGGSQNMGNNGWGQQNSWGGNNGWNNNQSSGWETALFGQGQGGKGIGQEGLEMALFGNSSLWGNDRDGFDWVQQQVRRQAFSIINPGTKSNNAMFSDIGNILQKQITFLQPSPAFQKLEQLKREGRQFYDQRFPPNQDSLCGEYGHISQWSSISWKKISEVLPNSMIFKDRVEPGDIKQGYLGDCYFLAGLAALAQRPDRIFSLFLLKETNQVRYFSVKMLYKGKWMTIDMDENIPCLYNKPAFSGSIGNQLWVILLEKAWAKMYSSYKRIQAGYPQQALHDLTGAPIKQILFKQAGFNKQAQWQYLVMASQKEYSMVASSKPGSDRNKSQTGIVQGHAYTFLNATVLHYDGGMQRIVQLRNPWGKGQSKGRWSDEDPNWRRVPPSEMQRIKYSRNANDGIFFMTYDAFINEFRSLTVAEINDNASYIYKSMKDRNREGVYFKIEIIQSGYYSLQVDKTPQRSFEDRLQTQYNYPEARLQLAYMSPNSCQKLQTFISAKRTLFRGYQLNPGVYLAYVKISFDTRWQKDYDVNLAVYAEYACDIQLAPRELVAKFTGNANVRWNPVESSGEAGNWNSLGNTRYQPGDSGWGNGGNNGGNNGSNGWGSNDGWGNTNNNNNNNGWGASNNNSNNNGWGTGGGNNNGWGNNASNTNNNNGWGIDNNNGWGTTVQPKKNDDGWGGYFQSTTAINNNNNNNNGWGATINIGGQSTKKNDDGWQGYFDNKPSTNNNNNNNGWGNTNTNTNSNNNNNNNNGWGPGW